MKERPILFSGEMVRAIRDGRKSQTRRVVKQCCDNADHPLLGSWGVEFTGCDCGAVRNPYGQPGDRLWVRETWRVDKGWDDTKPGEVFADAPIYYEADGEPVPAWAGKRRSSMFMPQKASRITLEVADVRVERLQAISEADAIAEGCDWDDGGAGAIGCVPLIQFAQLWDSINGKRGYSWESNPWVWAVSFNRVDAKETTDAD